MLKSGKFQPYSCQILPVYSVNLFMKRLIDDDDEIAKMLDLNTLINQYIGKRKPAEDPKPKLNIVKPLLVFDINLGGAGCPPSKQPLSKITIESKSNRQPSKQAMKVRSHTTLSTDDQSKKILRPITKYERVQSAKSAISKLPPKSASEPLDTGLQKHHFSSLDARCRKPVTLLKNRYEMGPVIGRGHSSTVNKARDTLTNRTVAIKILNGSTQQPKLFRYLQHPNIIQNLNTFLLQSKTYIVLQYLPMTLNGYLRQIRNHQPTVKVVYKQICRAVEHMHMQGIIHRDIKLENILVDQRENVDTKKLEPVVKLIDFGLAMRAEKNPPMKDFCGTPNYVAPEILSGEEYEGKPADCWALGVVLYLMLVGRFPFKAKQQAELYRKIKRAKLCFPTDISQKGKQLITKLLRVNPSQRPTIYGILNDNWFD